MCLSPHSCKIFPFQDVQTSYWKPYLFPCRVVTGIGGNSTWCDRDYDGNQRTGIEQCLMLIDY